MSVEIVTSFVRQSNASDTSMSGAKVYVYNVGTTTLRDIYSASDLSGSTAANPIICDSAGRHDMRYTAAGSYKIVVKTSADVTVYTRDNVDGRVPLGAGALAVANGGTAATTAGAALTNLGAASSADVTTLAASVAALAGAAGSTEKTHIATGTTAQRASVPSEGDIRRNTTIPQWEGYNSSAAWEKFITDSDFASQATQETGTSITAVVVTGRQKYHPSACKGWVEADVTGGVTASFNVTSFTDVGTGSGLVNWTTVFSSANYNALASMKSDNNLVARIPNTSFAAGVTPILVFNLSAAAADPNHYMCAVFGDQ